MKETKIYLVWDKIAEEGLCVTMGKNDKDVLRSMIFSGFFKVNRLEDIEIIDTGAVVEGEKKGITLKGEDAYKIVNIEKVVEELKLSLENKAEDIEKKEMKEKLNKTEKEGKK